MSAVRVLIVAPYASVRAGLHVLIAAAGGCAVIGEASGSADLERLLPAARPDVVLMQGAGDGGEGDTPRVLDLLASSRSDAGVVILGESRGEAPLRAGAALRGWAFLMREADGPQIAAAVRAVAAGLIVLDRSLAPLLTGTARGGADPDALAGEALTGRESEVLQLMAEGLPNKGIAVRLGISQHTVKFHVAAILAKLGASSRTEAVMLGARRGYVLL
jgi:DNA-binding NarL/FixJ family response regulator